MNKKYKVIKSFKDEEIWFISVWSLYENISRIANKILEVNWFIEEIKEKKEKKFENLPKYKVWDYAVMITNNYIDYIKIFSITKYENNDILYNDSWNENELRKPTQKELDLYFR